MSALRASSRVLVPSTLACASLLTPLAAHAAEAAAGSSLAERAPGSIAFAILIAAVLCAWLLDHAATRLRVLGTGLAAVGCFALLAAFAGAVTAGVLDAPKAHQAPMDAGKPFLLWTQAAITLGAGIALSFAAWAQARSAAPRSIRLGNDPDAYGRVSRMIHWTTAILFIALIPMGIFTSMIPEDAPWRNAYYVIHKSLGISVFVLVLARLCWNLGSPRPALDASLKRWERRLAKGAHLALYALLLAVPITGLVMTTFHGYPSYFFAWELEPLWNESETGTLAWGVFHKYILPTVVYLVLAGHVLGALKHRFLDGKPHALRRMVG